MAAHPYVPKHLHLDDYSPMSLGHETILGVFGVGTVIVMLILLMISKGAKLSTGDTLVIAWLGFSGIIHMVVEAPVVINENFYKETSNSPYWFFMNELWKEYGKADSRYLTRDACTIGIEAITAFVEGPLCILCVWGFAKRSSWRHVLTMLIVCGELYGTILYFYTSWHEGFIYQRNEPLYWWFYFVFMNFLWIMCPILIICYLSNQVCQAVQMADSLKAQEQHHLSLDGRKKRS